MLAVKIGQATSADGQPEVTRQREPGTQTVQNQAVNTAIINAGRQIATQGITQYADLTGNYAFATTVNDVLTIGSDLAILATGPVGVIAVGAKYTVQITNSFIQQKRAIDNIELQQQRAGYISTQGSRY